MKEKREKASSQEEKTQIRAEFAVVSFISIISKIKHNDKQIKEQLLYKARTMKSIQHPTEYISIIIDRMNTANVPLKMLLTKGIY
jgi:hypothetical protein